ncbi:hypothetical protein HLRTI_001883 [Halorhabdus tiamatea SARL4B]|uniref:Uncharacterized protein n=1 Tax=Halorhabdus tiamatea SARL4B TaxID=1033806 RepID=F7PQC3_9EURY|nr:hypothetical protein [Halorhabdus tiamatea]ERJ06120.1 hypothetical protein HLRTI_001883 [Halorhabdus tiamatea SARL4B]CCQ33252.1 conserved hypothetical protein [Halorhabdus tiamatea SARL4B]
MDLSPDDIAGVVDLFGALPPATLRAALAELAFKRGEDHDPATFADDVAAAVESYHLLELPGEEPLLVVGPVAFPTLPEGARDLPHILDAPDRSIDRDRLATAAERRFRRDAGQAVAAGDPDRIETLLSVSYELEAWAPVDLAETRDRLDDALEGTDPE